MYNNLLMCLLLVDEKKCSLKSSFYDKYYESAQYEKATGTKDRSQSTMFKDFINDILRESC